jgi:hypothetical protein
MAWQGVEIEIEVPCAGGQTHPVRLRFTGWGEFEVAYNPCEELLGPVFARMAACTHYLHEKFPKKRSVLWRRLVRRVRLPCPRDTDLKRRLVEAFGAAGAPAVPALIQALGDSEWDVRRAAAEALGKSATPKPCPRSACGRTQAKTPHATRCRRSDTLCLICHKRLRRLPRMARGAY